MKTKWLSCLLLAFVNIVFSAENAPVSLDIPALLESARTVTAEKYPNADFVLVDDILHITYQPDGHNVKYDDQAYKILTEAGLKQNQSVTIGYNESYEKASFELVQVFKQDGAVFTIDLEKQTAVSIDSSSMSSNIYDPHDKVMTTTVPGLEVGDVLRFITRQETFKPRVPNSFCDYLAIEGPYPIVRYAISIDAPKALPLQHKVIKAPIENTVSFEETAHGGRIHYNWLVQNVPQMFSEPDMPDFYTVVQRLLVSTIASWEDVSTWYWNLCKPQLETTADMKQTCDEILQGLHTDEERIRAIFRFVSQEIRYMGITLEENAPGYEPHPVAMTFKNRHGVCRDKAALLVAMLRLAGYNAYPVLIHVGSLKDSEVPVPYFNHAITAIQNQDGTFQLMDSTNESTRDLFPPYLTNQSYLVAHPDGVTLQTTPFSPAKDNLMSIVTKGILSEEGTLTAHTTLAFNGINDTQYRMVLARKTASERRKIFERLTKAVVPGSTLQSFTLTPENLLDTETPLSIELDLASDTSLFIVHDDIAMMTPPQYGLSIGLVNFILGGMGLDKRKYPLETGIACGVVEESEFTMPDNVSSPLELPTPTTIDDAPVFWKREFTSDQTKKTLRMNAMFTLDTVQFSPEQYLALKEHLKTMNAAERQQVIYSRTSMAPRSFEQGSPDVTILDHQIELSVQDQHTWTETTTVHKRIETYQGKKSNSEIKISFNPAWEDIKLDYARVIIPSDTPGKPDVIKSISEHEINIMDAPWTSFAKRYPAAKTFVASLPGVELHSVVQYKITRTFRRQPFFSFVFPFQGMAPAQNRTVILKDSPGDIRKALYPQGYLHSPQAAGKIIEDIPPSPKQPLAAGIIHENMEAREKGLVWKWSAADVPAIVHEASLPPLASFLPAITLQWGDWSSYAQELAAVLQQKSIATPAIQELARTLKGKATPDADDETLITLVRDAVERAVRTAGPTFTSIPFEYLSTPETTWTEGYGNQADKAILLYTLLKELGFNPEYILASPEQHTDNIAAFHQSMPQRGSFNTLLIRVTTDKDIWLGSQNRYAQLGTTDFDNCQALRLDGSFFNINVPMQYENRTITSQDIALQENGAAKITRTITVFGDAFGSQKQFFAEQTPEERKRYFQSLLSAISPSAVPQGTPQDFVTHFDSYPGTISIAYQDKSFATIEGDFCFFSMPIASFAKSLGLLNDTRANPLYRTQRSHAVTNIRLSLPDCLSSQEIHLPKNILGESYVPNIGLTSSCFHNPNSKIIECSAIHLAKPLLLSPQDYDSMLLLNKKLTHPQSSMVLIRIKK